LTAAPAAQPTSLWPGLAFAIVGAIAFSGKAIIVKLSYRYGGGADAITVIMLRMLFALPLFVLMAWWAGRDRPPMRGRDLAGVIVLGMLGYWLSSTLDFIGLQDITASLNRLIQYLTPTMVLVLGWLLYGKRFTRLQVVAMGISYCGVLLVFGREIGDFGPNVVRGAALVFASSLTYAVYLVYSGQLVQRIGSMRLVGWATSVACICCIVQFLVLRPVQQAVELPAPVLWLGVLNAVVCTAVPVLLVMMAVERLGPALTSQTGMIGPLSTIAMGALLLGEPFTGWVAVGTVLCVAGIWTFTRAGR
jgi:drug/metabolite transporter (DMT)-like permease